MARGRKPSGRALPAYCEHKGTGQAFVRLTIDGKRKFVYLGEYNSRESLDKYDQVVGEEREERDQTSFVVIWLAWDVLECVQNWETRA